MTPTVTQVMIRILASDHAGSLTTAISLIVIVLLMVFLVLKEALRANVASRSDRWVQTLNVAIYPLALAFCQIIALRLMAILGLS
jgi:hypothetical protein